MSMKMKSVPLALPLLAAATACSYGKVPERPNILLVVADDLGIGDVSAYGRQAIHTPNIDSLADDGVLFKNGYATSATSTPSRYAIFTGLYPWRNAKAKILPGDAPLIIPTDIPTLPKLMQENGYATAAIGKWHLGMGEGKVDWNKQITPSANTVGFDYTCLIAATNDRVPTVYVENGIVENLSPEDPISVSYSHNFEGEPTALTHPEMLKMKWHHGHNNSIVNGIPRIGFMTGGEKARWVDEDMADYFVDKVKNFIDGQSPDRPFFLYYGLHQPHVPRVPNERFAGKTGLGPRGDAVVEADWCVGEIISYLRSSGFLENTLIIFTSDNGPVLNDGYQDGAEELAAGHDPRGGTRGGKYSLYDGGTHVPLIVYWKGVVKPVVSEAIVCQLDFFASLVELIGGDVPYESIDSRNHIKAFLGRSKVGRKSLIHEAQGKFSYRSGNFALIPPYKGARRNVTRNELGNLPEWSLFNLEEDRSERQNVAAEHPRLLEKLQRDFIDTLGEHCNF